MYRLIILSLVMLVTACQHSFAQLLSTPWTEIEKSIAEKSNLVDLKYRVDALRLQAEKSANVINQARCFYYGMLIQDKKTEDTLYFRNSAFIDSILLNPKSPGELKALMYILKGKRLLSFNYTHRKFNRDKYQTRNLPYNYAALSSKQTDSLIKESFNEALKVTNKKFVTHKDLLWLTSTPDVFLFDPSLSDIVHTEFLNHFVRKGMSWIPRVEEVSKMLDLPSRAFLDSMAIISKDSEQISEYLKWINESQADPDKASFLETLLRKYFFVSHQSDSAVRVTYLKYLTNLLSSPVDMVKAHSVYQQCLLLYEDGSRYQYTRKSVYQYLLRDALKLYKENKALVDKFPVFSNVLTGLEQSITSPRLEIRSGSKQMVQKPILLEVNYKNVKKLYYHIVTARDFDRNQQELLYKQVTLFKISALKIDSIALPSAEDYNYHSAYVKLAGLSPGDYYLIFSIDKNGRENDWETRYIKFTVSDLVVLNTEKRLFVLNRSTGRPVPGAQIKAYYGDFKKWKTLPQGIFKQAFTTNNAGFADVDAHKINNVEVIFQGDTLREQFAINKVSSISEAVYNKDDYDDLMKYHDEQVSLDIFTDRSIYRPGQTVYYKALMLTRNPKTGDLMVFNKKNVGAGIFNKAFKNGLDDAVPVLYVKDPMRRKMNQVKLKPDEYGSFSGSFKIPLAATPGEWSIESDEIEVSYRNSNFRVEEYKRPTFEISLEKPKKILLPGENFSLKYKVKSFNAASLNNLSLSYSVRRRGGIPDGNNPKNTIYRDDVILKSKVFTDDKGEALVEVTDTLLQKLNLDNNKHYVFKYEIEAEVKDATGETVRQEERISVSNHPIKINIQSPAMLDRQKIEPIVVTTSSDFVTNPAKTVRIKIYKILKEAGNYYSSFKPDQWLYPKEELVKTFPTIDIYEASSKEQKVLVDELTLNTGEFEKLKLDTSKIHSGLYMVEAEVRDNQTLRGTGSRRFSVYDSYSKTYPTNNERFVVIEKKLVKAGQSVKVLMGSRAPSYVIYHLLYAVKKGFHVKYKHEYFYKEEKAGLNELEFKVPDNAFHQFLLTRIKVSDNKLLKVEQRFEIPRQQRFSPEVIVESYRKVLVPGEKATFTVSIKTKNRNTAAQLMSTMYDASLDKLEEHQWRIPSDSGVGDIYFRTNWSHAIDEPSSSHLTSNPALASNYFTTIGIEQALLGRLAGVSIGMDKSQLDEVVVTNYQTVKLGSVASTVRTIQLGGGANSLADFKQPLIIVDGDVFTGDFSTLSSAGITQVLVLKGADATALYGAQAARGVLVLSTKGPIVLPQPPDTEPVVKIRKNFNETAFFYPRVYADRKGIYTLSFTIPETATEWNWKMLAHTKDARFAYAERKLNTQLNLMVQPHLPRLLYQGDKINLMSRISNMDTVNVSGIITCTIEDAITGLDITSLFVNDSRQSFSANKKQSVASGFWLTVPANQINPLKVVIKAATSSIADAEEHIIPVYSTRTFVNKVETVDLKALETFSVKHNGLPADAAVQGVGLSIHAQPQSALLNSLTWLANYSYDCAEQTFNKLYAHITALNLIRTDNAVQSLYERARMKVDSDTSNANLPSELDRMEIPWLKLDAKNEQQQKQLYKLLDSAKSKEKIKGFLQRIYKLQNADGGISWFDGGRSNDYISAYLLAGFGRLKKEGWKPEASLFNQHEKFISSLLNYTSRSRIIKSTQDIFTLYSSSVWKERLPDSSYPNLKKDLAEIWKRLKSLSLADQALLITTTLRFLDRSDDLALMAKKQLKSIRQLAIEDEVSGLRWKEIADDEALNHSTEETVAFLSEAFKEEGTDNSVTSGILKWLLSTHNEENWRTTKGTAAAIKLLEEEKGAVLDQTRRLTFSAGTERYQVTNDILSGSPYAFIKTDLKTVPIVSNSTDSPTKASVNYYYFTAAQQLDSLNKQVKVSKKMLISNGNGEWLPLKEGQTLKSGEKVKVVLSVTADKPLKFVYIDDKRPAGFEPVDISSEYKFQEPLYYYCSVRDIGLQLFAESIPSGTSEISYELKVSQEGTFFGSPAVLQCMYNPATVAYSNTISLKCGK